MTWSLISQLEGIITMGAMLLKELICIRKQSKMLFFGLGIAFIGITPSLASKSENPSITVLSVTIALTGMLAIVLTINAMAYEEKTNWDIFVRSLPLSSRTIVGTKYILALIFSFMGTVLSLAATLFFHHWQIGENFQSTVWIVAGAAPLLICSILLPLFFKFGMQKTRLVFFLFLFILPLLAATIIWKSGIRVSQASLLLSLKVSPLIVFAVVTASFFISCHIYSRKEL